MNKTYSWAISILMISMTIVLTYGCKNDKGKDSYLRQVLENLDKVVSASYLSVMTASAPGDTTAFNTTKWYIKEFNNPSDTTIGSSFGWFYPADTSKMYLFYDGFAKAYIDSDIKTITIDSFKTNKLPFRPVGAPFFNYTKCILKYALTSKDSLITDLQNLGDSLLFSLTIYSDKQVEFHGNPVYNGII